MEIPDIVDSFTRKTQFGCGNIYVTINELDKKPIRVFMKLGKTGLCARALLEAVGRLVTLMFEYNIPLERIQRTLAGIRCAEGLPAVGRLSCLDNLARDLKRYIVGEELEK